VRIDPGKNPPATAITEIYKRAGARLRRARRRHRQQGRRLGVAGQRHLGAFDRRKCKGPLNGPKATGDHCPEGWTFYQYPGPGFDGIGPNSAESSYYSWVDQHNTFGLGNDVPMSTGNLNDGLIALKDGKMVTLRVPYRSASTPRASTAASTIRAPAGRTRAVGRHGDRTPWLIEGGKGPSRWPRTSAAADPLAH